MADQADSGISDDRNQRQKGFDSSARPTVHYPDNLDKGLGTPPYRGYDSSEGLNSRPSSIAGNDSEDYDWSGEDDLEDEEAKFEQQMGVKSKPLPWNFKRIVISLFSTLVGSTFLAAVLVTPGVLIQFYWYKVNPTEHRRYVKDNVQAWLFWAAANLLISWHLAIAVNAIPILAQFFVAVSWGHVSEYTKTRIEMYDTIKDSIKPLLYAASGWASWVIIFGNIYDLHDAGQPNESRAPYTNRLGQVIEFLFFFALVICIKRMLSHTIAFSFHRTAYKDRVDSLQDALIVIEKLRDYRPKFTSRHPYGLSSRNVSSEQEHFNSLNRASHDPSLPSSHSPLGHGRGDGEDGDIEDGDHAVLSASSKKRTIGWKGKGKKKDQFSWTEMRGRQHHKQYQDDTNAEETIEMYPSSSRPVSPSVVTPFAEHRYPPTPKYGSPRASLDGSHEDADTLVQAAKAIKHVVLHDARNIKGKSEGLASAAWNVSSAHEAKRLARSIFMKFRDRHRNYLIPSDFYPAFPDTAAAEVAFRVFDKDDNGDISRPEVKSTLVKVYKERRFLSRSMRDVSAALKTLDQILFFLAMVILFFISLSVFGVEVGSSLTSVYSLGIAASFIFKNTASSAFDAIMFLFVTHPYDTGDRVFVDQDVLVVKKVGLFATVFIRADGTETYYFNSQLFNKFITNVRRSGKTFENLTMQVAWRTPLAKLDALESCMNEWLSTEENRWFEPSTNITLQHIEFQRYLSLTIGIAHNRYDWGLRQARKTAFHAAVQYYCRQLEIDCFESPIPIVYCDSENRAHASPGNADGPASPTSKKRESGEVRLAEETESAPKEMQATLGFLPPRSSQPSQLTRARKSKSKKTMYGRIEG